MGVSKSLSEDEIRLARMGYRQEFPRAFGLIHNFGISLSHICVVGSIGGLYTFALGYGGPVGLVWGWIFGSIMALCVGCSMAEICSAYPTAGGLYYWSAKLGGDNYGAAFAWFTGWFNLLGDIAASAGGGVIVSQTIFTVVLVKNPDYDLTQWKLTLLTLAVAVSWVLVNASHPEVIKRVLELSVFVHTIGLIFMIIAIGAMTPTRQSASFVFTELINFSSGQDNQGWSLILSLLMPAWTFIGYDASAHVSEETLHSYKQAPRGIFYSIVVSAVLGFITIVVMTFSIVDVNAVLGSTYPAAIMQLFLDSTNETVAIIIVLLVGSANYFGSFAGICANSRMIYAFSRDKAFGDVLSKWLYYTSPRTMLPVRAICLSAFLASCIISIGFGSSIGLQIAASIGTIGMMTAYGLPIFCRLTFARKVFKKGEFHLGPLSELIGWISILWIVFLFFLLCMPYNYPVNALNFNYASVLIGGVTVVAGSGWLFSARKWFKGPVPYISEEEVKIMELSMSESKKATSETALLQSAA
ncbi:APC amino acid permease [Gonapodya prolifera JEL478]|uniref:APC amino acid permease n=1 Tax=Gonapodya prolifera (strain JEL478) TaxID=1344416 RepID=A0A139AH60_GONPJ|nr:APC amino acid permease [Gonapodya prolifera JEL478]|eukprot:KXS16078.1 APC amino acid permease [Gonapodya prolifera JEL478]